MIMFLKQCQNPWTQWTTTIAQLWLCVSLIIKKFNFLGNPEIYFYNWQTKATAVIWYWTESKSFSFSILLIYGLISKMKEYVRPIKD